MQPKLHAYKSKSGKSLENNVLVLDRWAQYFQEKFMDGTVNEDDFYVKIF